MTETQDSTSFVSRCADQAEALLAELGAATDAYAAASGLRCREGCGQCCLRPGIETQVVELLPLARALLASGEADAAYERAGADPDGRCVFYRPSGPDETRGRCGQYALRPSLCRLFGFAAVSGKDGRPPALAACHWHKRLTPDTVATAQQAIDGGAEVPLFSAWTMKFRLLAPTPALAERLPINRALMRAIEKMDLATRG